MGRSVYSLVLTDDVVAGIDKLAYSKNTSRSNLINQILAEQISYITPEKRMKDIFEQVEGFINGEECFQIQTQSSDAIMSVRSALRYKYKPTIRYGIELYRNTEVRVGELKVFLRTQNEKLVFAFEQFLNLWVDLENRYLGEFFTSEQIVYLIEGGKFTRQFMLPRDKKHRTNEFIAKAIAEYIQQFDNILKVFFSNLDDGETATYETEQVYLQYLRDGIIVI